MASRRCLLNFSALPVFVGLVAAATACLAPGLNAQTSQPEPIGHVVIDGVGRLNVWGAPPGQSGQDAIMGAIRDAQSAAFRFAKQERVYVFAAAEPGVATKGYLSLDLLISDGVIGIQSPGIVYYEASEARYPLRRQVRTEHITVVENSEDGEGGWNVRITFEGPAIHIGSDAGGRAEVLGDIPMKGEVVVRGMPIRAMMDGGSSSPRLTSTPRP